jgi:predicted RNase H-like HicB family nuclease
VAGIPVAVEIGSKRVFASALEWPGWCRQGKTPELALAALEAYAPRYARVVARAGTKLPARIDFDVAERLKGDATTDFGAPSIPAASERKPMTRAQVDRMCELVEACWAELDSVAKSAPQSLRKGPRGGGRDRDKMVAHVFGAESGYAPYLGLKLQQPDIDDRKAILANRKAMLEAFRAGASGEPLRERGGRPARYMARRIAWHALDHAWEMEDRSEG